MRRNTLMAWPPLTRYVWSIAFLCLCACSTSPPVRYYTLNTTVPEGVATSDRHTFLGFGPMRLADYLNRQQIVTRNAGLEVTIDEFRLWAEPLAPAIHRTVSTDIENLLPDVAVVAFPWDSPVRDLLDYRVAGDIIRFEADVSGQVILETQWSLTSMASGEPLLLPRRTRYVTQAAAPDDPGSVAAAMNEALGLFSREVAREVGASVKK